MLVYKLTKGKAWDILIIQENRKGYCFCRYEIFLCECGGVERGYTLLRLLCVMSRAENANGLIPASSPPYSIAVLQVKC